MLGPESDIFHLVVDNVDDPQAPEEKVIAFAADLDTAQAILTAFVLVEFKADARTAEPGVTVWGYWIEQF